MPEGFIPPHGGYENLLSYRKAEIVYDAVHRQEIPHAPEENEALADKTK